jgi:regulatory protein
MKERGPKRLAADALWQYALKVIGGRAQSLGEMRQKLRLRAERLEDVEDHMLRLKELGYLDDARFAESFANSRLSNDRLGRTRVIQDLRQRRVAPGLAETTVTKVYENVDEPAMIEDWIRRKYRMTPREGLFSGEKDMASAYRRLARAGFRSGEIIRVLKRFAKNPELLDSLELEAAPPPEEMPEE